METQAHSRSLDGAVVLVTGASGSIGRATCAALREAGARVVGTDLAGAPSVVNADAGLSLDVTSAADWRRVIEEVRTKFHRLDGLVNSAGICPLDSVEGTSLEVWRKTMSVNAESILLGMQATLPLLRESAKDRDGGSSIVNLASTAGVRGVPFASAYCASKGALTLLTKSAAKEFARLKYGVRVNSVHPSSVDSPMMDLNYSRFVELGAYPSIEAAREKTIAGIPMGRMAGPEDVAGGIVFLCTPAARFVNGLELIVDGGLTA